MKLNFEKNLPTKGKLRELFCLWLSLPSTGRQVQEYFQKIGVGEKPESTSFVPRNQEEETLILEKSYKKMKNRMQKPKDPKWGNPVIKIPKTDHGEPIFMDTIPQFYFPKKKKEIDEDEEKIKERKELLYNLFSGTKKGEESSFAELDESQFRKVTTKVFGFVQYVNKTLFEKLKNPNTNKVQYQAVIDFFENEFLYKKMNRKYFNVFKKKTKKKKSKVGEEEFLEPKDFSFLLHDILNNHPGLAFLLSSPAFQEKYSEAVVIRFFYTLNPDGFQRITLKQFSSLNNVFIKSLRMIDTNADINKELNFFSYEHFYVLYCKFWELDSDHDFQLTFEDLHKYANNSLTKDICKRVFYGYGNNRIDINRKFMSFEDFIWFCLSEEDKTTETAAKYWFRCIDLDGDGFISLFEIKHFFKDQNERMRLMTGEEIKFEDLACQIFDMLNPSKIGSGKGINTNTKNIVHQPSKENAKGLEKFPDHVLKGKFSFYDFKNKGVSVFYDILFNLSKFLMFEQRGFSILRNKQQLTPWNYFARVTYDMMSLDQDEENEEEIEELIEEENLEEEDVEDDNVIH